MDKIKNFFKSRENMSKILKCVRVLKYVSILVFVGLIIWNSLNKI